MSDVYQNKYTLIPEFSRMKLLSVFQNLRSSNRQMPEIIDPVFAKTSPKRSFCMTENERFGLVLVKTGSINSGKREGKRWRIFFD